MTKKSLLVHKSRYPDTLSDVVKIQTQMCARFKLNIILKKENNVSTKENGTSRIVLAIIK